MTHINELINIETLLAAVPILILAIALRIPFDVLRSFLWYRERGMQAGRQRRLESQIVRLNRQLVDIRIATERQRAVLRLALDEAAQALEAEERVLVSQNSRTGTEPLSGRRHQGIVQRSRPNEGSTVPSFSLAEYPLNPERPVIFGLSHIAPPRLSVPRNRPPQERNRVNQPSSRTGVRNTGTPQSSSANQQPPKPTGPASAGPQPSRPNHPLTRPSNPNQATRQSNTPYSQTPRPNPRQNQAIPTQNRPTTQPRSRIPQSIRPTRPVPTAQEPPLSREEIEQHHPRPETREAETRAAEAQAAQQEHADTNATESEWSDPVTHPLEMPTVTSSQQVANGSLSSFDKVVRDVREQMSRMGYISGEREREAGGIGLHEQSPLARWTYSVNDNRARFMELLSDPPVEDQGPQRRPATNGTEVGASWSSSQGTHSQGGASTLNSLNGTTHSSSMTNGTSHRGNLVDSDTRVNSSSVNEISGTAPSTALSPSNIELPSSPEISPALLTPSSSTPSLFSASPAELSPVPSEISESLPPLEREREHEHSRQLMNRNRASSNQDWSMRTDRGDDGDDDVKGGEWKFGSRLND